MTDQHASHHHHVHGASCACGHDHAQHQQLKRPVPGSLLALGTGPKLAIAGIAVAAIWIATIWVMRS